MGANLCKVNPGDELYLLFGRQMPIVLRSVSEGVYRLMGTVFVCGIINGEAMEELDATGWVPNEMMIV